MEVFDSSKKYSTRISGAPGVAREIKIVLNELTKDITIDELEKEILENNLLDKSTLRSRNKTLSALKIRYLENPDVNLNALLKLISSNLNEKIKDLVLYYYFCKSEKVVYDVVIQLLFPMYLDGKLMIPKKDIVEFFDNQSKNHPEAKKWTPTIKERIAEHILASLKHFGIVKGSRKKEFNVDYIPKEAIIYVVFDLLDKGYNTKRILNNDIFKIFFLEQDDLIRTLDEAAGEGIVDFKYTENIYYLDPLRKDLEGYIDEIVSKV